MEHSSEEWQTYVEDMLAFCAKVLGYAAGLKQDEFVANRMIYDATLHNLILIGEAANQIPKSIQKAHPEVPWTRIIGMRNKLIHGYRTIDDNVTWHTTQNAVPSLVTVLQHRLASKENLDTQQ